MPLPLLLVISPLALRHRRHGSRPPLVPKLRFPLSGHKSCSRQGHVRPAADGCPHGMGEPSGSTAVGLFLEYAGSVSRDRRRGHRSDGHRRKRPPWQGRTVLMAPGMDSNSHSRCVDPMSLVDNRRVPHGLCPSNPRRRHLFECGGLCQGSVVSFSEETAAVPSEAYTDTPMLSGSGKISSVMVTCPSCAKISTEQWSTKIRRS